MYSYPDVLCIPGTGTANLNSIICGAPKGAKNPYNDVAYYGHVIPQPTGAGLYNLYNDRFVIPSVVVGLSG